MECSALVQVLADDALRKMQEASSEDSDHGHFTPRCVYDGILMRTRSRSESPKRSKKENIAPRALEMLESIPRSPHFARVYAHTCEQTHKQIARTQARNSALVPYRMLHDTNVTLPRRLRE